LKKGQKKVQILKNIQILKEVQILKKNANFEKKTNKFLRRKINILLKVLIIAQRWFRLITRKKGTKKVYITMIIRDFVFGKIQKLFRSQGIFKMFKIGCLAKLNF